MEGPVDCKDPTEKGALECEFDGDFQNGDSDGTQEGFDSLFVNYMDEMHALCYKSHSGLNEKHQKIMALKEQLAELNVKIAAKKRSFKKRMKNALHMTDNLSVKIRKIAAGAEDDDDSIEEEEAEEEGDGENDTAEMDGDNTVILH